MMTNAILTGEQMYYTSCKLGLSGAAGFQTKAKSSGLDTDQQQLIERLGLYKPPRNLSDEPSRDEISEKFPVLYKNYTLESGQVVILKSEYVGKDYSNRWGNYFSHGLFFNSLPDDVWPVDIYEWTGFKKDITAKENDSKSTKLPIIQITKISNAFPLSDLQEFINEDNLNIQILPKIIQAVFLKSLTSRNIVIKVDLESDAMYWVACIQKCFPVSLQKHLNSSTYQFDPRTCMDINATFGDTDFLLSKTERDYQFYVFDFSSNKFTQIDQANEYAKTVAAWISSEPTKLVRFFQICKYFNIKDIDDDLILVLSLFKVSIGENEFRSEEELLSALHFIQNNIKLQYSEYVAKIVHNIINNSNSKLSFNVLSHIATFYVSASKVNTKYINDYFEVLPKLLFSWLVDDSKENNLLIELKDNAREIIPSFDKKYAECLLSEKNISYLITISSKISIRKLGYLVNELISAKSILINTGNENKYAILIWDFIKPVIISMSPQLDDLDWLLSTSLNNPDALKNVLSTVINIIRDNKQEDYYDAGESVARYLNNLFKTKEVSYRYKILSSLATKTSLHPVIQAEWKLYFDTCKDKISCFSDYYDSFLINSGKYLTNNNEIFIREVWKQLIPKEKQGLSIYLIDNCIDVVPRDMFAEILFSASSTIPLADVESFDLYDQLCGFRDKNNISITPDRLYLRQVIEDQAYSNDIDSSLETTLNKVSDHLDKADESLYREFLNEFLPDALHDRTNQSEHDAILRKLYFKDKSEYFLDAYSSIFKSRGARGKQLDLVVISYWLGENISSDKYNQYHSIKAKIFDLLRERFFDLDDRQQTILARQIKDKHIIHETQIDDWKNIQKPLNKGAKTKSFLKNFFRK